MLKKASSGLLVLALFMTVSPMAEASYSKKKTHSSSSSSSDSSGTTNSYFNKSSSKSSNQSYYDSISDTELIDRASLKLRYTDPDLSKALQRLKQNV